MKQVPDIIDIRLMKDFVRKACPPDSLLRQVILIDDDMIPREEMIGRAAIWFKLKALENWSK